MPGSISTDSELDWKNSSIWVNFSPRSRPTPGPITRSREDTMLGQLGTIWKYRHFWLSLVVMDLRTRYRRSILGVGWSLMNPLMMTIVFCVVFGAWFHNPDWRA